MLAELNLSDRQVSDNRSGMLTPIREMRTPVFQVSFNVICEINCSVIEAAEKQAVVLVTEEIKSS